MASRTLLNLVTSLCFAGSMVFALPVSAETVLTQATIQRLKATVELHLKQKGIKRQAQKADVMTPGDALRTYKQAMAELRFNDRSLARIGEQAIFQFEPNTRDFDLQRGTVLLLIKPGQGKTRVRTPNAAAGIRGSALFVRYIEDSNVTMVGALTNSDIEISNNKGESVVLKAGQLAYVYKDQIGVYNFDQKLFQETSPFFKDIDWNEAPEEVKEEITAALQGQQPVAGKFEDSPAWTKLAENRIAPAPAVAYTPQQLQALERLQASVFPDPRANPSGQTLVNIPPAASVNPPANPATNPPVATTPTQPPSTIPAPPPGTRPAPLPENRPAPESRPVPQTQSVPQIPVAPPVQVTPPASNIPSAANPPTRPVASPPPAPATPVVVQPTRPSPVVAPPAATPAVPAVPATPTTPAVPAVPATPAPVTPTAAPIVNSAPVAASVAPPVAPPVVPVTPPVVATPPATPPSLPVAPATPPATAPSDLPQAVPTTTPAATISVTTSVTTTPAATPTTTTPATTPAVEAAPATRAIVQ